MCLTPLPRVEVQRDPSREVVFAGTLRGEAGTAGGDGASPRSGGEGGAATGRTTRAGDGKLPDDAEDNPGAALDAVFGDLGGAAAAGYDLADGYGSYHQQYWLDGELIAGTRTSRCWQLRWQRLHRRRVLDRMPTFVVAVGVVDVLPQSFCSNYFLYNPSYRWLNLGKVSALYEMQWLRLVRAGRCCVAWRERLLNLCVRPRQARQRFPRLKWYNLCMYVHRCHRMDYKPQYKPGCQLLCPKYYVWQPFDECKPKLDTTDGYVEPTDTALRSAIRRMTPVRGCVVWHRWACLMDESEEELAVRDEMEELLCRQALAQVSWLMPRMLCTSLALSHCGPGCMCVRPASNSPNHGSRARDLHAATRLNRAIYQHSARAGAPSGPCGRTAIAHRPPWSVGTSPPAR